MADAFFWSRRGQGGRLDVGLIFGEAEVVKIGFDRTGVTLHSAPFSRH